LKIRASKTRKTPEKGFPVTEWGGNGKKKAASF